MDAERSGAPTIDEVRISDSGRVSLRLTTLFAFLLVVLAVPSGPYGLASECSNTSVGLTPLTDLAGGTYEGEPGGLYPNGENTIPAEHLALGLELSKLVVPRAADGSPSSDGNIVMISIGVSNTQAKFDAFARAIESTDPNPHLILVNGAQVGRALGQWTSETAKGPWARIDERLAQSGVAADQVQVAWIMLPSGTRGPRDLIAARSDVTKLARVVQIAKARFPNLVLAYLSSRAYGGYIPDEDSEPNAYLHGYTVKWLIEAQIAGRPDLNPDFHKGPVTVPWMAWGPYLWADGVDARSDGLVWMCEDFAPDGVHPGSGVEEKVSKMLLDHFSADTTTAVWFNRDRATGNPTEDPRPTPNTHATESTDPPAGSKSAAPSIEEEATLSWTQEHISIWLLTGVGLGAGTIGGALVGLWAFRKTGGPRQ
jgi:hypothetical protein